MARIHARSRTPDILEEIGRRLRTTRLNQNLAVEEVAERSGVSSRTILRLEHGEGARLDNVVRVLRALGKLPALDAFLPEPPVSPRTLVEQSGQQRRRASPRDG